MNGRFEDWRLRCAVLLVAVFLVYLPHFRNSFHFDDTHTIVLNPYIRDLQNIPRFFTDATLFSVQPANRVYRPVVSTSLALDYWMGGSLDPLYFHLSTFFWFCVQLVLMYLLFRRIADETHPDARNGVVALFATAWFGLHPAIAETVNYVIQRADLYSTLGVLAGLLMYVWFPGIRRWGLYLVPVVLGVLSKPPALVFPGILFAYVWLFETDEGSGRLRKALLACVPSIAVIAACGLLVSRMTPATFNVGPVSAYAYRITQPLVWMRYFQTFFAPGGLTADTDRQPIASIWQDFAWVGFLFAGLLLAVAVISARRREWRPISFGLWWFFLALLPTSLFALSEVENDHRMFFPFVGLVLSVTWGAALLVYRGMVASRPAVAGLVVMGVIELATLSVGTLQRNIVWRTPASLWKDVVEKSPRNGRGLMNYGTVLLDRGDFEQAVVFLNRARGLSPNYALVEYNLGVAHGKLKHFQEAEQHFREGLRLNPNDQIGKFLFARWLEEIGRASEAEQLAAQCVLANPDFLEPMYLLMQISARRAAWDHVQALSKRILRRFPADPDALAYRLMAAWKTGEKASPLRTAANFLGVSALYYLAGNYEDAIAAAREVLLLDPGSADAYNNIAAAQRAQEKWDLAAQSARQALQLQPNLNAARQNLARAEAHKKDANMR